MNQFKFWFSSQPRAVRAILSVNVVVYLLWQLVFVHFDASQSFFLRHLALNPGLSTVLFEPWQLLTYSFLHLNSGLGGLLHILFNMMWMIWVGRDYEAIYGSGRLVGMYVMGAISGAVLTVLLHLIFPGVAVFGGVVHGASGAVLAILTMIAIHQPEQRIGLMFIGVVRLIHVVIGFLALDILFLSAGGTAISAHWGGVLAGLLGGKMILAGVNPTGWADWIFRSGRLRQMERGGRTGTGSFLHRIEHWLENRQSNSGGERGASSPKIYQMKVSPHGSTSDGETNVDRILDKISTSGYESLTRREKEILLSESEGKN
ncbi:MAG: rhomboid family intramembrane serine protease [Bacteroidetes bacterium]|nr:rhomboid family intramembrane serine protease [Bacteroidota bacterium]